MNFLGVFCSELMPTDVESVTPEGGPAMREKRSPRNVASAPGQVVLDRLEPWLWMPHSDGNTPCPNVGGCKDRGVSCWSVPPSAQPSSCVSLSQGACGGAR